MPREQLAVYELRGFGGVVFANGEGAGENRCVVARRNVVPLLLYRGESFAQAGDCRNLGVVVVAVELFGGLGDCGDFLGRQIEIAHGAGELQCGVFSAAHVREPLFVVVGEFFRRRRPDFFALGGGNSLAPLGQRELAHRRSLVGNPLFALRFLRREKLERELFERGGAGIGFFGLPDFREDFIPILIVAIPAAESDKQKCK